MGIHRSPTTLLQSLKDELGSTHGIVAVDGVDGSGKSTLARKLSALTDWKVLHLDDFLTKDQGTYVQHLDLELLNQRICDSIGTIIVEGVCLLAALEDAGQQASSHIYVKRLGQHGNWLDEDDSCFLCSADQKIAELSAQVAILEDEHYAARGAPTGLTEFRKEVIRYHAARRPFERAAHIYEWVEDDA